MRTIPAISISLLVFLLPFQGSTQEDLRHDALAAAEFTWPSSKAPSLFGPDSISSRFAAEGEDRFWSPVMESRILAEIERAREDGLVLRQTDVECRTSTCALLLIHATPQSAVNDLASSLGAALGLTEVDRAATSIPLGNELGMAFAYVELVLSSDRTEE
jgi:hypothetical protein